MRVERFLQGLWAVLVAFVASAVLTAGPEQTDPPPGPVPPPGPPESGQVDVCGGRPTEITVQFTGSTYRAALGQTSGFFQTGQDADLMLSGIDFNNTGGPLLFNHPSGIATDGTRLIISDTFNNRILIWRTPPAADTPPDVVLGQGDFTSNMPGTGRDQLNWPQQVTTDGRRLAVADTYNDRILVWNNIPDANGTPADLVIQGGRTRDGLFAWPWGVWTDGEKLVVAGTGSRNVLIWTPFPTRDDAPPAIRLQNEQLGTPRTITSDGQTLIVGDHNARIPGRGQQGTFFWRTFPMSNDAPFDFFREERGPAWLKGTFLPGGRLAAKSHTLQIWDAVPASEDAQPALAITSYNFRGGDYGGVAYAGGRLYVSSGNSNKIVVYNEVPTRPDKPPDFAIGSSDICTNTLDTNFFITNGAPASDGTSLFVASDFDTKLYVWRRLPDESGAHPDVVYTFPQFPPWDIGLHGNTLAVAGGQGVYVWDRLPLDGELPTRAFKNALGSVVFRNLRGVAIDGRYFYLADADANKVHVWAGIPSSTSEPTFSLDVNGPRRLSSDGEYLTVTTTFDHAVLVYPVRGLGPAATPAIVGGRGTFNLPEGAYASDGRLFVADTGFNRVHVWSNIEDALAGRRADIVLGEQNFDDVVPEIGRNKTFWPGAVFFDGRYLWLGEFKFSNRLLRFSPRE